ncbi:MAG TPA: CDP-alcohol phosphatidyltransferase family protein [Chloroflexia bacterium]|nr:CDP-alcohol phosphatidyltransferase family protein [Chloroflexia bacterium]
MITQRIQGWARGLARNAAQIFTRVPFITPNVLTLFGFVLNAIVAYLLATQHLVWGGVMMLFAGLFDMLDGALAKITNQVTDFGGFLDSVVDRYSEAVILFGMLLYFYQEPNSAGLLEIVLLYTTLVGSMMISYARSRAGMLGIANEVGLLARPERIIILGIGLLAPSVLLDPALWILAIGTQITAFQRIIYVWQVTQKNKQAK